MRISSSVTAVSWVPFGSLDAVPDVPLALAAAVYDTPPPERIHDPEELRGRGAYREINDLRAWIEVVDGRVVGVGHEGGGTVTVADVDVGPDQVAFVGGELPAIRPEPVVLADRARFVQTVGGRIGLPIPRPLAGKPYPHVGTATAWTTLELTIRADGTSRGSIVGASPFPSHWVYGPDGHLLAKREAIDLAAWARESWGDETPWDGGEDDPVAAALERELARSLLSAGTPMERRTLRAGETLVQQGDAGEAVYLLLIGALDVEVDGRTVAQVGAGAIVGERAALEGGRRTATLRAATPCRIAVVPAGRIGRAQLRQLASGHRREQR